MQHSSPPQRLEWLVWATIGLAVGLVLGAYGYSRLGSAGSGREEPPLPVLARVTGFDLTNHLGQAISAADLWGQPWLAGIIFTRCPGPCVRLTRNLVALQGQVPATTGLRFLLLTADPQYDVPEVLRQYGERWGADPGRWQFVTGPQARLYRLATEQLLLAVAENPEPETASPQDLFLHTTKVVLVDRQGQVRAAYDGEDPEALRRVPDDLRRLARDGS